MQDISEITIETIINSLSDGVYVCDLDRKITHWSKSAERITGWSAKDIVGVRCYDNVLSHVDKDGHHLCGKEYCPLHRAMVTGTASKEPLLVYANRKDGKRIPTQVNVAPIHNSNGKIIGGVETFRDSSALAHDLERAKAIQQLMLNKDTPEKNPVGFTTHYVPKDIVGGDYYAIKEIANRQYGFILADVMGHGIASALYTMCLSSLWDQYYHLLKKPAQFGHDMNKGLRKFLKGDDSFATAIFGIIDFNNYIFRFASAGGPNAILIHSDGVYEILESSGLPLGLLEDASYDENTVQLSQGDALFLVSDGAAEVRNAEGKLLGLKGLIEILKIQGCPRNKVQMGTLEEKLLKYSNTIRLEDDLTLIEIHFDKPQF
jgi:PAS domain S-box-containing protein